MAYSDINFYFENTECESWSPGEFDFPPQVSLPLTICTLAARLTALTVILAFQVCQLEDMVLVRVEVKVSQ